MVTKSKNCRSILLVVTADGRFKPLDDASQNICAQRKYKIGQVLAAELKSTRDYKGWTKAHRFGQLIADNIDDFAGMNSHTILKRLQLETGVGCDLLMIKIKNIGMVEQRIPKSFNFTDMDEIEFNEIMSAFYKYIIENYWQSITAEELDNMAKMIRTPL